MKARGHIRSLGVAVGVAAFAAALLLAPGTAAAQADDVTFTRDVAPILQRSCQTCHREGSIAPMSLLTYEETRPWARAIREKVETRTMPPWYIDKNIGVQGFKYDRSLSDAEIATLANWVDAGAPRGNPADMPPPVEFAERDKWHIGEPDWVVPIPEPFVVPAEGANWWGDLFADLGLTEDRWIKAVETKPSAEGFPVVHHAVTRLQESMDADEGDFLNEYAQGKNGDIFPPGHRPPRQGGVGRPLQHALRVDRRGADRPDQRWPAVLSAGRGAGARTLLGAASARTSTSTSRPARTTCGTTATHTFDANVRLTGFQPHLHNRGKRQCIEAILPDGNVDTLSCADWDFGWHIVYNYADAVQPLLPKGTILHTITWHDNSRANRWNPDPRNWAGFGQRSSDDMSFTWTSWYELDDEEFEAAVAERQALTANDN